MARELMPPYEMLLVSMGAEGGILVTREEIYAAHIPSLDVVSTVGSGDAAFAGALFALEKGMDKRLGPANRHELWGNKCKNWWKWQHCFAGIPK